jgi:hypothetical protein
LAEKALRNGAPLRVFSVPRSEPGDLRREPNGEERDDE